MKIPDKNSSGSIYVDALRGLSAILVLIGHVRLMLFVEANTEPHLSIFSKAFYFATNLGGASVMVFFVLSGYLVGSSVIRNMQSGKWSWLEYFVARASRLYVVLIPALLIGWGLDAAGLYFFNSAVVYSTPHYGVMLPESIKANLATYIFIGNALFFQEILVPTFGSNHPLWSLTNEAWYYFMFPWLAAIFFMKSYLKKLVCLCVMSFVLVVVLPSDIENLFIVWLMGALLSVTPKAKIKYRHTLLSGLFFLIWLAGQSLKIFEVNQFISGFFATSFICCIIAQPVHSVSKNVKNIISYFSNISFSLYLFHTPIVVLLTAFLIGDGPKLRPGLSSYLVAAGVVVVIIIYSTIMWYLFERKTPQVRNWITARFC
jgi:peptidoglycan/LPS O-acetylase OafA/YrhL